MEVEEFDYQKEILHTACMLCVIYRELLVYGLNAALCDELQDMRQIFEEGEEYPADIAILESLEDPNIGLLLKMMYDIERSGESLLNINNISDEKLNKALSEGIGDECIPALSEKEDLGSYDYWMNDAMGYAHFTTYNLLQQGYRLSYETIDIKKEDDDDLTFPTGRTLELLDTSDHNVNTITELSFRMSDVANQLSDNLFNSRKYDY